MTRLSDGIYIMPILFKALLQDQLSLNTLLQTHCCCPSFVVSEGPRHQEPAGLAARGWGLHLALSHAAKGGDITERLRRNHRDEDPLCTQKNKKWRKWKATSPASPRAAPALLPRLLGSNVDLNGEKYYIQGGF